MAVPVDPMLNGVLEQVFDLALKSTVPIYTSIAGVVAPLATGVLLRIGGYHFLLTAAHVLDKVLAFDQHGIAATLLITPGAKGKNLIPLRNLPTIGRTVKGKSGYREDDPFDVGFLELTEDVVDRLVPDRRFLCLTDLDLDDTQDARSRYVVVGFPELYSATDQNRTVTSDPLLYVSLIYRHDRGEIADYNAEVEIVLDYIPDRSRDMHGERSKLPAHPRGISGCGIWRFLVPGQSLQSWSPNSLKLVGIQHTWNKGVEAFRGTRIGYTIGIISQRYDELTRVMNMTLTSFPR
jgi:hypothetical protein